MSKKRYLTLGICNDETSSVCLFINGFLASAVSEERFSRKKYDNSFPIKSINYILKEHNISLQRIDAVVYSWAKGLNPLLKNRYEKRFSSLKKDKKKYKIFSLRYKYEIIRDKKKKEEFKKWANKNLTKKQLSKLKTYYHHDAHAASAAILSPFDKGLVITADARGDFESLTISVFDRNKINPLKKIYSSLSADSFGFFYGRITGLLGFKPMAHEGKITGLAAHGNPSKALSLMKKMIDVKNGKVTAKLGDLYRPFFKPYSKVLKKKINRYSREDIAAAAQKHLENCLCKLTKFYSKKLKIKSSNLMLAGGVFANVKLNYKLKSLKFIKKVFVQPQMGDGGLCLGAATLYLHQKKFKITSLKNVFLGPKVSTKSILLVKKKFKKIKINKHNNVIDKICNDLKNNRIIGIIRGRMEFGPRALCNRSIFYKTSDNSINDWLNKRLNRTEFMPFAPLIRNEVAKKAFKHYIEHDDTFNFMTSSIKCNLIFKKKSPAVSHIDNSARPQVVYKNQNPFLWRLLRKWELMSEEMSLVNTSFNEHEEPIICNQEEGVKALKRKMIDVLYVENYSIRLK